MQKPMNSFLLKNVTFFNTTCHILKTSYKQMPYFKQTFNLEFGFLTHTDECKHLHFLCFFLMDCAVVKVSRQI